MNTEFTKALEALEQQQAAEEGIKDIFKPKTAEQMVAQQAKKIAKIKDVAKIDELLEQVNKASSTYDSTVKEMIELTKKAEAGEIDKKELAKRIGELSKQVQDYGSMIKHGKLLPGKKGASDEDLKFLKDYLEGVKKALTDRKSELNSSGTDDNEVAKESWTEEDRSIYNEIMASIAEESVLFDPDFYNEDIAIEGVNTDASKAYKKSFKETSRLINAAKKAKKTGDTKSALEYLDNALSNLKEIENLINNMEQTEKSAIIGFLVSGIKDLEGSLVRSFGTFGLNNYFKALKQRYALLGEIKEKLKQRKAGVEIDPKELNRYTLGLLKCIKNTEDYINKMKANIGVEPESESEEKASESISWPDVTAGLESMLIGTSDEAAEESTLDLDLGLESMIAEEGFIKNMKEKKAFKEAVKAVAKGKEGRHIRTAASNARNELRKAAKAQDVSADFVVENGDNLNIELKAVTTNEDDAKELSNLCSTVAKKLTEEYKEETWITFTASGDTLTIDVDLS